MTNRNASLSRRNTTKTRNALLPTTHSLTFDHPHGLDVLVSRPEHDLMGVLVGGRDAPQTARHMAGILHKRGLDVRAAHGERLLDLQGTGFAVRLSHQLLSDKAFLSLKEDLTRELADFVPPPSFEPCLSARLKLNAASGNKDLLFAVANVLGQLNVNLTYFRYDRGLLDPKQLTESGNASLGETQLLARLELPDNVGLSLLGRKLRAVCPVNSRLALVPLPSNEMALKAFLAANQGQPAPDRN
jgi:hypothetical protein